MDSFYYLIIYSLILVVGIGVLLPQQIFAQFTAREDALSNQLVRWNFPADILAVGTAYAAQADGLQGGLTNPASLSRIQTNQFSIGFQQFGNSWNMFNTGIAMPLFGGQSISFHATWLDYGELEPEPDTQLFRPQANEFKGGFTISQRVSESIALGLSTQIMSSEIAFRDRTTKLTGDFGIVWRYYDNLWFGAVGKNVNTSLRIDDNDDKLPTQFRSGVAWSTFQDRLTFTTDAVFLNPSDTGPETNQFGVAGGMEITFLDNFEFSIGYHNYYYQRNGLTGGFSVNYPNFNWHISGIDTGEEKFVRLGGNMRF